MRKESLFFENYFIFFFVTCEKRFRNFSGVKISKNNIALVVKWDRSLSFVCSVALFHMILLIKEFNKLNRILMRHFLFEKELLRILLFYIIFV